MLAFPLHLMWPLFTRKFLDLHLSQWPQYVALYWVEAVSAERGWLAALSSRLWKQCGMAAVVAALAVPVVGIAGGALSGDTTLITGGLHWEALVTAGVEGVIAVLGLWGARVLPATARPAAAGSTPSVAVLVRSLCGA